MDSALTPREIQTRIRAGESVADVARATGMDPARVEPFAVPVIAEREFIAGLAQGHPVRRGSETIAHRTLGSVVSDRLLPRQVDPDTVRWDAWKVEGRRWAVQVSWGSGKKEREGLFTYDQAGRFSVAENEDARWLLGLHPPAQQDALPVPAREEAEPTVGLNDELALVRVVQSGEPLEDTAPIEDDDTTDADDAFAEGELAEVDGLYDIIPNTTGGIDVLYDMLSGFDEDSVQIYKGLMRPDAGQPASPVLAPGPSHQPAADPEPAPEGDPAEPEQPALVEEPEQPAPEPKGRRKRAHVPSWDEIIFGSPTPKKP